MLTPDLEATSVESKIPWLLGVWHSLYSQGLMDEVGSWWEPGEHQDGAKDAGLLHESGVC